MVAGQGPFVKNSLLQNKNEKEGLESALVLGSSNLHRFLGRFTWRCFGHYGLGSRLDRGAAEVHKELRRQRVDGVRHTFRNLCMVSTDVVFKHTTSVPIRKDHLKNLLILFLHGLLVLPRLRMEGGHLIFGCLEL